MKAKFNIFRNHDELKEGGKACSHVFSSARTTIGRKGRGKKRRKRRKKSGQAS